MIILLLACAANRCGELEGLDDPGDLLFLGDSVLAWGEESCNAVPDWLASTRGALAHSNAVSGTRVLDGVIPAQYERGGWSWVIVDGGGNDLNDAGCADPGDSLDRLADAQGEGAMAELVDLIRADGPQVLLLAYYPMRPGAWYGFDSCGELLASLGDRYASLAERREGVELFDLGTVLDPEQTPDSYDFDGVHPSAEGAERIAEALWTRLAP